jgi:parallel beta-helix repeat protein
LNSFPTDAPGPPTAEKFSAENFSAVGGPGASVGNEFKENQANNNNGYGFYFDETSLDNKFKENTCEGNELGGSNVSGICDEYDD